MQMPVFDKILKSQKHHAITEKNENTKMFLIFTILTQTT